MPERDFALIGLGGIGGEVLRLSQAGDGPACRAVLVRPEKVVEAQARVPAGVAVVSDVPGLLAIGVAVVAECGGHQALRSYGEAVLRGGCDLLTVSSGAFSDPAVERSLRAARDASGRRLLIATGGILGLDGLAAARHGGLDRVTYRGVKPARAWRGTPAEKLLDLDALTEAAEFYRGSARESAAQYPANANVTATIALAGIGFERTEVRLVADPAAPGILHEITFAGGFGEARIEIRGKPSAANPRTSVLTGLSVWQALSSGMAFPLP
jgi:aspartate dehydrogenase